MTRAAVRSAVKLRVCPVLGPSALWTGAKLSPVTVTNCCGLMITSLLPPPVLVRADLPLTAAEILELCSLFFVFSRRARSRVPSRPPRRPGSSAACPSLQPAADTAHSYISGLPLPLPLPLPRLCLRLCLCLCLCLCLVSVSSSSSTSASAS